VTRPDRDRWWLLLSLVALSALSNAYIIAPASVLPVLVRELAVDATAAGWVVSAVFGAQIVASVPAGLAVDRFGGRGAVALATAALVAAGLWGTASAASGAYVSLVVSRLLGGAASIVIWNAGVTVIGGAFDEGRRATAVGAFTAASPAGFALGHLSARSWQGRTGPACSRSTASSRSSRSRPSGFRPARRVDAIARPGPATGRSAGGRAPSAASSGTGPSSRSPRRRSR